MHRRADNGIAGSTGHFDEYDQLPRKSFVTAEDFEAIASSDGGARRAPLPASSPASTMAPGRFVECIVPSAILAQKRYAEIRVPECRGIDGARFLIVVLQPRRW
jgi:hypothetical protein